MKWRRIIAWTLLAVSTIMSCVTFAAVEMKQQPPPVTSTERKELMEVSDMLEARLYQMVDAKATVQVSAGQGATASVNGNDAVGQINITTGTVTGAGSLVHITFNQPYGTQPFVVVAPMDQPPPANWYVTVDQEGFDIWVGTAPKADTNYPFAYFVAPRPWLMYLTP
jgi:hypothetical protein